jgi:GPH family glycoside/pentoside/hexuronide:cation symporter
MSSTPVFSEPTAGAPLAATETQVPTAVLTWRMVLAWSIGTIGPVTLLYVVNYAFMFFLTDLLRISAAVAGTLIFAVRVYDIFVDPLVGLLSDRTSSRMGRRRPWMLAGAVLSAAGCIALFTLPKAVYDGGTQLMVTWSLGSLLLYFTGYSMFNVPYMTMPAEMTDAYHERTRLMGARVFFVAISGLLGVSVAPLLVQTFGKGQSAYSLTAVIMAAVSLLAMLASVAGTARARATERVVTRVPISAQLRLAVANRPFATLISAKLLLLLAMSSLTSSMFYFVTHVLHRELSTISQIGLLQTIGMVISLPLWVRLSKRWAKHHLFMISCAGNAIVLFSWSLATAAEPTMLLLLRGFIIGCTSGCALLMGQSLLPDTMEYDYRRSGLRREGAYSGAYSMVEKAGFAIGPLIIGLLLSAAGYTGAQATGAGAAASAETTRAVLFGVSYIPAAASALCVLILYGYNLTESMLKGMTPPRNPTTP